MGSLTKYLRRGLFFSPASTCQCLILLGVILLQARHSNAGSFTVKTIAQSVPFPGVVNRITVTLRPDTVLSADTAITITGLAGATAAESGADVAGLGRQLVLSCSDASQFAHRGCAEGTASRAVWNGINGTVVFYPRSTWSATSTVPDIKVICFDITNPSTAILNPPTLYIEANGAAVFPKVPMWVNTVIKSLMVTPTKSCYPDSTSSTADPSITIMTNSDHYGVLNYAGSSLPDFVPSIARRLGGIQITGGSLSGCTGSKLRLTADGVKSVSIVGNGGCGCQGNTVTTKGRLVAAGGDGKFDATFEIKYRCDGTGDEYNTLESCSASCVDSAPTSPSGDLYTCIGHVNSVQVVNPGWGYSAPPQITLAPGSDFQCSGVQFTAVLNQGTGLLAETDVVYTCSDRTYASASACSASGSDCPCSGRPQMSSLLTSDGVQLDGIKYTSMGTGYAAGDVVSVYSADGTKTCTWSGALSQYITYTQAFAGAWRHVNGVTLARDGYDKCYSPAKQDWHYFHEAASLNVDWAGTAARSDECLSVVLPEMAPAPLVIGSSNMNAGWSVYGDSAPLKVYPRSFLYKRIRQSSMKPGQRNTITVTLAASVAMISGSTITITGLSGAILGLGPVCLTVLSDNCCCSGTCDLTPCTGGVNECLPFTANFVRDSSSANLILTVSAGQLINVGRTYVFSFDVINPTPAVDVTVPPTFTMSATVSTGAIPAVLMDRGDEGSSQLSAYPLMVEGKKILKKNIFQAYSYEYKNADVVYAGFRPLRNEADSLAENQLTVQLQFNIILPITTYIDIYGLTGIDDDDKDITLIGSDRNKFASEFCNILQGDTCPVAVDAAACAAMYFTPSFANKISRAKWTKDAAAGDYKLRLFLTQDIPADTVLTFSYIVKARKRIPTPTIMIRTRMVDISRSTMQSMPMGVDFPDQPMHLGWPSAEYCREDFEGSFNPMMQDSVPFYTRTPAFLVKNIGQSNPFPCPTAGSCTTSTNTITITMATNTPFDASTHIIIGPLTGAKPLPLLASGASSSSPVLSGPDAGLFESTWDANTNRLTLTPLTLQPGSSLQLVTKPGRSYVVSFVSQNPTNAQESPQIMISATSIANAVNISSSEMNKDTTSILFPGCTAAGDASPLRILAKTFCLRSIQQSSSLPEGKNILTVSLSTTVPLTVGSVVTISGWPSATDMNNKVPTLDVTVSEGTTVGNAVKMGASATFDGDARAFKVTLNRATTAGSLYVMTMKLDNWSPVDDTSPAALQVLHGSIDGGAVGMTIPGAPASNACLPDIRPLKIFKKAICVKRIGQGTGTTNPGASNRVMATLITNFEIPASTAITLRGIDVAPTSGSTSGANDVPFTFVSYDSASATMVVQNSAVIQPSRSIFDVDVNGVAVAARLEPVLRFFVINSNETHASPDISVGFTVGGASFSEAMVKDNGKTGDYGSIDTDANPLKVYSPRFIFARVGQSNPYPSADNKITVTFAANFKPKKSWVLAITGFNVARAAFLNLDTTPLLEPSCSSQAALPTGLSSVSWADTSAALTQAKYDASNKVLRIKVDDPLVSTGRFTAGAAYKFEFRVKNPTTPEENPPTLTFKTYVTGTEASATPVQEFAGDFDATIDSNVQCMVKIDSSTGASLSGSPIYDRKAAELKPFYVRRPRIIRSFIVQSSPYPLVRNVLTVALFFNVDILARNPDTSLDTKITIQGLSGIKSDANAQVNYPSILATTGGVPRSCLVPSAVRPGGCQSPSTFAATQTQLTGGLIQNTVDVFAQLPSNVVTTPEEGAKFDFTITLTNPETPQVAASVSVAVSGAITLSAERVAPMTGDYKGVVPTDFLRWNDIWQADDATEAQALKIRTPAFGTAFVSQQSPFPGIPNKIFVLFNTNVPLLPQSVMQVSGLNAVGSTSYISFVNTLTGGKTQLSCWGETDLSDSSDIFSFRHQNDEVSVTGYGTANCKLGEFAQRTCKSAELLATVTRQTIPGRDYKLAFTLLNPATEQPAQALYIQTSYVVISQKLMVTNTNICGVQCLNQAMDRQPLYVRRPSFTSPTAFQTNPWPGADNSIVVNFQVDMPLEAGTKIQLTVASDGVSFTNVLNREWASVSNLDDAFKISVAGSSLYLASNDVSYHGGIVSAVVTQDAQGAGCTAGTGTGAVDASMPRTLVSVNYQTQCGRVTDIFVTEPGTNYWDGYAVGMTYTCATTQPTVSYLRSDQVFTGVQATNPTFDGQVFTFTVQQPTSACSKMGIRMRVSNPVTQFEPLSLRLKAVKVTGDALVDEVNVLIINSLPNIATYPQYKFEMCPLAATDATACKFGSAYNDVNNKVGTAAIESTFSPSVGDSSPFKVYKPSFTLAQTGQASHLPGDFNTIFVRFATNYKLSGDEGTTNGGTKFVIKMESSSLQQRLPLTPTSVDLAAQPTIATAFADATNGGENMLEVTLTTALASVRYGDYLLVSDVNALNTEIVKVITHAGAVLTVKASSAAAATNLKDTAKFPSTGDYLAAVRKVVAIFDYMGSEGVSDVFQPYATMERTNVGSTQTLTLTLRMKSTTSVILPGRMYSFKFCVRNPENPGPSAASANQDGYTVSIMAMQTKLVSPRDWISWTEMAVSSMMMQSNIGAATADARPLRVVVKGLIKNNMRQSTALPGTRNRMQNFITPNFPLPTTNGLEIDSLRGAGFYAPEFLRKCSNWENPVTAQCNTFDTSGWALGSPTFAYTMPTETGTSSWTKKKMTVKVQYTKPTVALADADALSMTATDTVVYFSQAFMQGDFIKVDNEIMYVQVSGAEVAGQLYLEHTVVRAQLDTTAATHLRDAEVSVVLEMGANDFFCSAGTDNSFPVTAAARNIVRAGTEVGFSFDVYNPAYNSQPSGSQTTPQEYTDITVRSTGLFSQTAVVPATEEVNGMRWPDNRGPAYYSKSGDLRPMKVYPKGWIYKSVHQSLPFPGATDNVITVTLVPSLTIHANTADGYVDKATQIIISGFANATAAGVTDTIRKVNLAVAGQDTARFDSTGVWDDDAKSFSIYIKDTLHAGEDYSFQFTVANPLLPQLAPTITIHTAGPVSGLSWTVKDVATCNFPSVAFSGRTYNLIARGGGGGTGFAGTVTFSTTDGNRQVQLDITSAGSGYTSTPSIEFAACPADSLTATDPSKCGCPIVPIIANVDGVKGIANVAGAATVICSAQVINGTLKIETDGSGQTFGTGLTIKFDVLESGLSGAFPSMGSPAGPIIRQRIVNFGSGYAHVPYWTGDVNQACVCDYHGAAVVPGAWRRVVSAANNCGCSKLKFSISDVGTAECSMLADDYGLELSGTVIFAPSVFDKRNNDNDALRVIPAVLLKKIISQWAPWPAAINTIVVTLTSTAELPANSRITIEGLDGANMQAPTTIPNFPDEQPYMSFQVTGSAVLSQLRPAIVWQPATSTHRNRAIFTTLVKWPRQAERYIVFQVMNRDAVAPDPIPPPESITIRITTDSGFEIIPREDPTRGLLTYDESKIAGIEGAARPLALYTDTWPAYYREPVGSEIRVPFYSISQTCPCAVSTCEQAGIVPALSKTVVGGSTCRPQVINTVTVTIVSNVALGNVCARPCFSAAKIVISGFKGTSDNQDPALFVCTTTSGLQTNDGCIVTLKDVAGTNAAGPNGLFRTNATFTRFKGGFDVGELEVAVADGKVMVPGREYRFSFQIKNGNVQEGPPLQTRVSAERLENGYTTFLNPGISPMPDDAEGIIRSTSGPSCFNDGKCRNVRISLRARVLDATAGPLALQVRPPGSFTSVLLTFPNTARPGTPAQVSIAVVVGPDTTVRAGQTVMILLDSSFSPHTAAGTGQTGTVSGSIPAAGDARSAMWNTSTNILSFNASSTKVTGQTINVQVTMTMPVAGVRYACTNGGGPSCLWGFESPADCADGVVEFTRSGISASVYGSLYPTRIRYDTAGQNVGVAGQLSVITLWFSTNNMALAQGSKVLVTLPNFAGSGSGSNADFSYTFASNVLTLTSLKAVPAGSSFAPTIIGTDAGIYLPTEGLTSAGFPAITIASDAVGSPPVEPIQDQAEIVKFSCQLQTVRVTGTSDSLCNSAFEVRACSKSSNGIQAYLAQEHLTDARGYIGGRGSNSTTAGAGGTNQCKATHSAVCTAINPDYQAVVARADTSFDVVKASCCQNSPDTAVIGLGSIAVCAADRDCNRGVTRLFPASPDVYDIRRICCRYCYNFYGIIGCVKSDGSSPDETDPSVVAYCNNTMQCVPDGPSGNPVDLCFGNFLSVNSKVIKSGGGIIKTLQGSYINIDPRTKGLEGLAVQFTELIQLPDTSTAIIEGLFEDIGRAVQLEPSGVALSTPALIALRLKQDPFANFPGLKQFLGLGARRRDGNSSMDIIDQSFYVLIHKIVNGEWKPVGPSWVVQETENLKAIVQITSFSVYAPFVSKLPTVPPFKKYLTTTGWEVYPLIVIASFLTLLLFIIALIPCCTWEDAWQKPRGKEEVYASVPITPKAAAPPMMPVYYEVLQPAPVVEVFQFVQPPPIVEYMEQMPMMIEHAPAYEYLEPAPMLEMVEPQTQPVFVEMVNQPVQYTPVPQYASFPGHSAPEMWTPVLSDYTEMQPAGGYMEMGRPVPMASNGFSLNLDPATMGSVSLHDVVYHNPSIGNEAFHSGYTNMNQFIR